MRFVFGTTLWQRPHIETCTLRRFAQLKAANPTHEIILVAVGSEGAVSEARAVAHGWHYYEYRNHPLGAKHNELLRHVRTFEPDAFVLFGSDDWITDNAVDVYAARLNAGVPLFGFLDIHLVDTRTAEGRYFPGYPADSFRAGWPIGAGRVISRRALDALTDDLWHPRAPRKLDQIMTQRLAAVGFDTWDACKGSDVGVTLVDWKGEPSVSKLSDFAAYPPTDVAAVLRAFPRAEVETFVQGCPALRALTGALGGE